MIDWGMGKPMVVSGKVPAVGHGREICRRKLSKVKLFWLSSMVFKLDRKPFWMPQRCLTMFFLLVYSFSKHVFLHSLWFMVLKAV